MAHHWTYGLFRTSDQNGPQFTPQADYRHSDDPLIRALPRARPEKLRTAGPTAVNPLTEPGSGHPSAQIGLGGHRHIRELELGSTGHAHRVVQLDHPPAART